jgi:hypothetical protein
MMVIVDAHQHNGWRGINGLAIEVRATVLGSEPNDRHLDEEDDMDLPSYKVPVTPHNDVMLQKLQDSGTWHGAHTLYREGHIEIRVADTVPADVDNEFYLGKLPKFEELD